MLAAFVMYSWLTALPVIPALDQLSGNELDHTSLDKSLQISIPITRKGEKGTLDHGNIFCTGAPTNCGGSYFATATAKSLLSRACDYHDEA